LLISIVDLSAVRLSTLLKAGGSLSVALEPCIPDESGSSFHSGQHLALSFYVFDFKKTANRSLRKILVLRN